jgi:hypothetical protein
MNHRSSSCLKFPWNYDFEIIPPIPLQRQPGGKMRERGVQTLIRLEFGASWKRTNDEATVFKPRNSISLDRHWWRRAEFMPVQLRLFEAEGAVLGQGAFTHLGRGMNA